MTFDTTRFDHTSRRGLRARHDAAPRGARGGGRELLASPTRRPPRPGRATRRLFTGRLAAAPRRAEERRARCPARGDDPGRAASARPATAPAAFVSSFVISRRFALRPGLRDLRRRASSARPRPSPRSSGRAASSRAAFDRRGDETTRRARRAGSTRTRTAGPFFLFVHYFDPARALRAARGLREPLRAGPRRRRRARARRRALRRGDRLHGRGSSGELLAGARAASVLAAAHARRRDRRPRRGADGPRPHGARRVTSTRSRCAMPLRAALAGPHRAGADVRRAGRAGRRRADRATSCSASRPATRAFEGRSLAPGARRRRERLERRPRSTSTGVTSRASSAARACVIGREVRRARRALEVRRRARGEDARALRPRGRSRTSAMNRRRSSSRRSTAALADRVERVARRARIGPGGSEARRHARGARAAPGAGLYRVRPWPPAAPS